MSEALILASINPQYDKRLFIELRVQYMKSTSSVHVGYINCSKCQKKPICAHNWTCSGSWLVDARISASDRDLTVQTIQVLTNDVQMLMLCVYYPSQLLISANSSGIRDELYPVSKIVFRRNTHFTTWVQSKNLLYVPTQS